LFRGLVGSEMCIRDSTMVSKDSMVGCKNLIDWDFLNIFIHSPDSAMPFLGRALILASFRHANERSFWMEIMN
jgi:hypothetical protein